MDGVPNVDLAQTRRNRLARGSMADIRQRKGAAQECEFFIGLDHPQWFQPAIDRGDWRSAWITPPIRSLANVRSTPTCWQM